MMAGSFGSCQDLRAGWYETNQGYLWGGHAGITLANLPASGTSICGATNTSAVMGPWTMLDLRYEDTTGSWYNPSQLQATYAAGTPCPPYGAGTVTSGSFEAGSNEACSTGTSSYP
jgi:hypothetical protein